MALKRIQINEGPAMVDIINLVPGNDLSFQLTIDHDITDSTFEAEMLTNAKVAVGSFVVSGVSPLVSGVVDISMNAAGTELIGAGCTWYLDELSSEGRETLYVGNVELYYK